MDDPGTPGHASPQPPFTVEPTSRHTHTFILLHGLGSNGPKFGAELVQSAVCANGEKLVDIFPGARFIFPTARRSRSSAFNRTMLTQWFDAAAVGDASHRSERELRGLGESYGEILRIVGREAAEASPQNVILGGLSQGCAMGLICLLALTFPIGGFIGMSGRLLFNEDIRGLVNASHKVLDEDDPFSTGNDDGGASDPVVMVQGYVRHALSIEDLVDPSGERSSILTPVFFGHGDSDETVRPSRGREAYETMRAVGLQAEWKCYADQGHWYKIPDEINDIVEFIKARVGWAVGGEPGAQ